MSDAAAEPKSLPLQAADGDISWEECATLYREQALKVCGRGSAQRRCSCAAQALRKEADMAKPALEMLRARGRFEALLSLLHFETSAHAAQAHDLVSSLDDGLPLCPKVVSRELQKRPEGCQCSEGCRRKTAVLILARRLRDSLTIAMIRDIRTHGDQDMFYSALDRAFGRKCEDKVRSSLGKAYDNLFDGVTGCFKSNSARKRRGRRPKRASQRAAEEPSTRAPPPGMAEETCSPPPGMEETCSEPSTRAPPPGMAEETCSCPPPPGTAEEAEEEIASQKNFYLSVQVTPSTEQEPVSQIALLLGRPTRWTWGFFNAFSGNEVATFKFWAEEESMTIRSFLERLGHSTAIVAVYKDDKKCLDSDCVLKRGDNIVLEVSSLPLFELADEDWDFIGMTKKSGTHDEEDRFLQEVFEEEEARRGFEQLSVEPAWNQEHTFTVELDPVPNGLHPQLVDWRLLTRSGSLSCSFKTEDETKVADMRDFLRTIPTDHQGCMYVVHVDDDCADEQTLLCHGDDVKVQRLVRADFECDPHVQRDTMKDVSQLLLEDSTATVRDLMNRYKEKFGASYIFLHGSSLAQPHTPLQQCGSITPYRPDLEADSDFFESQSEKSEVMADCSSSGVSQPSTPRMPADAGMASSGTEPEAEAGHNVKVDEGSPAVDDLRRVISHFGQTVVMRCQQMDRQPKDANALLRRLRSDLRYLHDEINHAGTLGELTKEVSNIAVQVSQKATLFLPDSTAVSAQEEAISLIKMCNGQPSKASPA